MAAAAAAAAVVAAAAALVVGVAAGCLPFTWLRAMARGRAGWG